MSAPFFSPKNRTVGRARGFTAVELLVVLAVFAALFSMVLIPLTLSRRKASRLQCLDNLKQVNHALMQYGADNNQTLPSAGAGVPGDLWWWYKELIKRYAGLTGPSSANDQLFSCPGDRGYTDAKPFHANPRFDFTSYVFNAVNLPGCPNIAGWKLSAIQQPQKTLSVMEWAAHAPLSWHDSKTGKSNLPFYNDALSVVSFVDGHADYIKIYYDGYNAAFTRDPIAGYEYKYSGF
jgi:prepilin-type N-terminal cleavage/methylation domain-containing protein